ncbi:unnamed protein product [Darwinula stevensoni]|uniref:Chitin-binding type-2 domain-containing protein n=1 Tax=Darwinula stevensoni TaxID=69355 RepID=A0A7R8XBB7_9CRUS|nr:unnamed protein product [Darwinula stevensoni]CAG0884623.1 unnamed protein product [Darwinula stevensoni]
MISVLTWWMVAVARGALLPPPNYSVYQMPDTNFDCRDKIVGGYYADNQAHCQMFHVCVRVGEHEVRDFRFLCPNDTIFDKDNFICANWWEVECVSGKEGPHKPSTGVKTPPPPTPDDEYDYYYYEDTPYGDYQQDALVSGYPSTTPRSTYRSSTPGTPSTSSINYHSSSLAPRYHSSTLGPRYHSTSTPSPTSTTTTPRPKYISSPTPSVRYFVSTELSVSQGDREKAITTTTKETPKHSVSTELSVSKSEDPGRQTSYHPYYPSEYFQGGQQIFGQRTRLRQTTPSYFSRRETTANRERTRVSYEVNVGENVDKKGSEQAFLDHQQSSSRVTYSRSHEQDRSGSPATLSRSADQGQSSSSVVFKVGREDTDGYESERGYIVRDDQNHGTHTKSSYTTQVEVGPGQRYITHVSRISSSSRVEPGYTAISRRVGRSDEDDASKKSAPQSQSSVEPIFGAKTIISVRKSLSSKGPEVNR